MTELSQETQNAIVRMADALEDINQKMNRLIDRHWRCFHCRKSLEARLRWLT